MWAGKSLAVAGAAVGIAFAAAAVAAVIVAVAQVAVVAEQDGLIALIEAIPIKFVHSFNECNFVITKKTTTTTKETNIEKQRKGMPK